MKLTDCHESYPDLLDHIPSPKAPLPQCFETERFVPPLSTWTEDLFDQVINDINILVDNNEINRARGLMTHWFIEVSPMHIAQNIIKPIDDGRDMLGVNRSIFLSRTDSLFEVFGALAFKLEIKIIKGNPSTKIDNHVTCQFERGWIIECINTSKAEDVFQLIQKFHPKYLNVLEDAVENAIKKNMFKAAQDILEKLLKYQDKLTLRFRIRAAYWSLKIFGKTSNEWIDIILELNNLPLSTECKFPDILYLAKTLGWLTPWRDTGTIASEIIELIISESPYSNNKNALFLALNVAATIGGIEEMISKGDICGAKALVSPEKAHDLIKRLWNNNFPFRVELNEPSRLLSFELFEICKKLEGAHFEMIVSLCLEEASNYPVEQKMLKAIWNVLKFYGHKDILRNWADYWIGEQGHVWFGTGYSEKIETVTSFAKLCRDEEWFDLAIPAEEKIRYCLIGYSSHKEVRFSRNS